MALAQNAVGRPFVWGSTDCVILSFMAVDAMLGTRLADDWAGRWGSRREAVQAARIASVAAELAKVGAGIYPGAYAQPGDVLLGGRGALPRCCVDLGHLLLSSTPAAGVTLLRVEGTGLRAGMSAVRVP